jgi:RND superfamily putative drug exporter
MATVSGGLVAMRWRIALGWLVATAVAVLSLPGVSDTSSGAVGQLVPDHARALAVEKRAIELFGIPTVSRNVVVERDPGGLSARGERQIVQRAIRATAQPLDPVRGAVPLTPTVLDAFAGRPHGTALTYLFYSAGSSQSAQAKASKQYAKEITPRHGATVAATGTIPARATEGEIITQRLRWVELATALLVVLAVGLHFRALAPPFLTLLAIAVAYLFSDRVIGWGGEHLGASVPREVRPVIVVLVFGLVTDYSIFYLSRYRARLREGDDADQAVRATVQVVTPIVVAAGLAIVAASASLLIAKLGFLSSFGPAMAVAAAGALVVSISFVPAVIAILGRHVLWPRGIPAPDGDEGVERRTLQAGTVRFACRHPWLATALAAAVIAVGISGLRGANLGDPLIVGLPDSSAPHRGYSALARGLPPGAVAPTAVLVQAEGRGPLRAQALARLRRELAAQPGVAGVIGPGRPVLPGRYGVFVTPDGRAARYAVILDRDPLSAGAIDRIETLESRLPALVQRARVGAAHAGLAGDTALIGETIRRTNRDLAIVWPAALVAVFIVFALFLRSLLAPLVLVIAGGLAVASAVGFALYVFRGLLGEGGLVFFVPFATSVLLLSLGADYSVFLTGRIWREARTRESLRAAVIRGGSQAALPITTAGLVLAGSFALLAIVPVRAFHQVAFTMAAGLVLDAFLVRTLLAPALITLLGPAGGWPARRMRGMRRGDRDLAPAEAAVAEPTSAARGGGASGIDDPPGRPPA